MANYYYYVLFKGPITIYIKYRYINIIHCPRIVISKYQLYKEIDMNV